jgi:hypothetical protein
MINRRRRLAARFLAIGLLAATLFAVDSLASPSPAEARCTGVGNEVRSTFSYGGGVAVSETPVTGTCNGNSLYTAVVKDTRADGYCVRVEFFETGYPFWFSPAGSYVCGYGNTSSFEFRETNDNSRAYERLCLSPQDDFDNKICGWGTVRGDYGTNWGF